MVVADLGANSAIQQYDLGLDEASQMRPLSCSRKIHHMVSVC